MIHIKGFVLNTSSWKVLVALFLVAFIIAAILLGEAAAAPDSGYTLDWWTLDAGGGVSSGGSYNLSGGVAQPEGGMLSGGNYLLQGGFWQGTTYLIHLPVVFQ